MYSPGIALLAVASFTTWLLLHVYPIRGDTAVVAYAVVVSCLYVTLAANEAESPAIITSALSLLYAAFTGLFTILYRVSPWHKLANYPGPFLWRMSSLPLVYISFMGKRYIHLDELHAKYGDFVRVGPDSLSVKRKSANTVIYGAGTHMDKADSYIVPGPKVVALFFKQPTREMHFERKKVWSPAFTGASIANFVPALEKRTLEFLHCIERRQKASSDGHIDIPKVFSHWAYDFTCDMLFGGCVNMELMKTGDPAHIVEGGKWATVILDSFGQSPWLIDLAWHLPIGKSQVRLRDECARMMERRVRMDAEISMRDITSYFLSASEEHRPSLEEMQLDAVVAIQGGSDNTSTTCSLACYYMLSTENGRQWNMLRNELDAAFPESLEPLSWDVLAQLPYLNAVISEALRLGSPYYLPRVVGDGGVMIDDRYIPEGVSVAIAAYSLQTSEENFYPDPLEFRAERWLPGGLGPNSITDKSATYSFSSGPHICIGKSLAHQEMRLILARLVLAFDLQLAPNFDAKAFRAGILNMRTTLFEFPLTMKACRRLGVVLPEDGSS